MQVLNNTALKTINATRTITPITTQIHTDSKMFPTAFSPAAVVVGNLSVVIDVAPVLLSCSQETKKRSSYRHNLVFVTVYTINISIHTNRLTMSRH